MAASHLSLVSSSSPGGAAPLPPLAADRLDGELARQSRIVEALGSIFVARVLAAADRQLHRATRCAGVFAQWPGNRSEAALAMRLNAGLQALARSGQSDALTRLYREAAGDFDRVIGDALASFDAELAEWLGHPTQTNETARSAFVLAALKVAGARLGLPFELLEIGASAGLNLNLGRYRVTLAGLLSGPTDSPVRLEPRWAGSAPPAHAPRIVAARGVDLAPLDLALARTVERLHAYTWADKPERHEHLDAALAVARAHPPMVEQGDALEWLTVRLAEPAPPGRCRVIVHSMVLQYLAADKRMALEGLLNEAYAAATPASPLARIGLEWTSARDEVRLMLSIAAGDGRVSHHHLAACHPYGDWIAWKGVDAVGGWAAGG